MSTPELYSETNVVHSLSTVIANDLLLAGYLVYWHAIQSVQTLDGVYANWNDNYSVYISNPTFAGRWNSAKGLAMLTDHLPTEPRFVERPISVVGPISTHEVLIPALSVEVGPAIEIANYELGSTLKWWNRHLVIEGYARNRTELAFFKDKLPIWFRGETTFDVVNHDAGSLAAVGPVQSMDTVVDYEIVRAGPEQTTYHVICNARLEYIA